MREILYRGKRVDCGDWTYGCYYIDSENIPRIVELVKESSCTYHYKFPIIPKTRGEYTGLCDKNGTMIFEGDIVKFDYYFDNPQLVKWNNEWCAFEPIFDARPIVAYPLLCETNIVEVIGNIHDNPELLEVEL